MAKPHHSNRLVPSRPDDIALAQAVEQRFIDLCSTHMRLRGTMPQVPLSLTPDMRRWRQMRLRHRGGDLRHTDAEMRSVRTFAQWTVDINNQLRNQPPSDVQWYD